MSQDADRSSGAGVGEGFQLHRHSGCTLRPVAAAWQQARPTRCVAVRTRLAMHSSHRSPSPPSLRPSFRAHPSSNQHPDQSSRAHISLPHECRQQLLPHGAAVDPNRRLLPGKGASGRRLPRARSQLYRPGLWTRCTNPLCRRAHQVDFWGVHQ